MFNFKLICVVIYLFIFSGVKLELSDKRLCANKECTEKISLARTLMKFPSPEKGVLSFEPNAEVIVYSKSAGSNMDLWGVEIAGVRGYAPKRLLRETRIFTKELPFLEETEVVMDQQVPSTNTNAEKAIKADSVPEHFIVDGTTFYEDAITPTSTQNPVLPTDTLQNPAEENKTLDLDNPNVNHKETEPLDLNSHASEDKVQVMEGDDDADVEEEEDYEDEDEEDLDDDIYDSEEENDVDEGNEEGEKLSDKENSDISVGNVPVSENAESSENSVKLRQLLNEKDNSEDSATKETTKHEEIPKIDENHKDVVSAIVITSENNATSSETGDLNTVTKEKEDNESATPDDSKLIETVTESAFVQNSDLEIPAPNDIIENITPNPIKAGSFQSISPSSAKIEQNTPDSNTNNITDFIKMQSQSAEIKEDTEDSTVIPNDLEGTGDESIEKATEINPKDINNEETLSLNTLSENNDLKQPEEQPNLDDNKDVNNKQANFENKIEENLSENIEKPNIDSVPESKQDMQSNVSPNEDEEQTISSETTSEPVNISDMLSGIKNFFSAAGDEQKADLADTIQKDQDENIVVVENQSVENEFTQTDTPQTKESEALEKHDHNIFSMFDNSEKSTLSKEDPQKIETAEEITEAPIQDIKSEKFFEEKDKKEEQPKVEGIEMGDETQNIAETTDVPIIESQNEITKDYIPSEDLNEVSHDNNELTESPEVIRSPSEEIQKDGFGNLGESHILDIHDQLLSKNTVDYGSCPIGESDCPTDISLLQKQLEMEQMDNSTIYTDFVNLLTLLGVTGLSVAVFLLGFIKLDKSRKEGSLVAKINSLEKALLVASKENALLSDCVMEVQNETAAENERISTEEYDNLNRIYQETLSTKSALEEQVQSLEKELENTTEVGLELNRMLQDILSSQNGSETLIANVEQLQRQLVEQQSTINTINDTLNLKDTENHELQLELEIKNKKVTHLQTELDKMAMNLFKVEEDKEQTQARLEGEITELKDQIEKNRSTFNSTKAKFSEEIDGLKSKMADLQRNLEVRSREYDILKENFNNVQVIKNNSEALESLLNASAMKAELQQLQRDNQNLREILGQEQQTKYTLEKQIEVALGEAKSYKAKYDEADKEKLEAKTKLEVLGNYFKEREAQLQKELSKQESLWVEKQGEASSTVERIKYMQEELQNYKSQNELLKQEIVSQEVELKSQISVLEKKAHESWLTARQAERRLEDAKQEAAQLRNRLTLKERSFIEEKSQNRVQSPLEQNGDMAISPLHMPVDTPASPPLLYGTRDHLTTSPPLPNLPPFLPPPPGVPFMPPPIPGVPGFMPPPPSMFPVDRRPPPLGRMSPPIGARYSPDSRYSPYDRNSPSPPYDDEYGSSPPPLRGYSPYNNRDDRRDYKRGVPPPALRTNGRNKGALSSGSENSNESLEKIPRHHSKV